MNHQARVSHRRRTLGRAWLHLLLALVAFAMVQGFLIKPFQVPSASMEPTLAADGFWSDRVLVDRLAYLHRNPAPGDVVVFSRPDTWPGHPEHAPLRVAAGWVGDVLGFGPSNLDALVKRVIAGPGDVVSCCDVTGAVMVNGEALVEPYLADAGPYIGCVDHADPRCFPPVTVPEDRWLVLGDNRLDSQDSVARCRGLAAADGCALFIERDDLIGRVFAIVLPPHRAGPLGDSG